MRRFCQVTHRRGRKGDRAGMLYSRSGVEHMRSERGDWAMGKPSDPTITFARRGRRRPESSACRTLACRLFQPVPLVFTGGVKPKLSGEGGRPLIARVPTRFQPVLEAIQYQSRRSHPGQSTATKLPVGLNLDLDSSPTDRRGRGPRDKHALMQDPQANSRRFGKPSP